MQTLTSFVRMEITVLLAALALIIAFQLLTGKINVQGLLLEKTGGATGGGYSPARLQLLLVTLAAAFYFLSKVVDSIHNGTPEFPTIPNEWLMILGGSHSIYLGGKVNSLFGFLGGPGATSSSTNTTNSPNTSTSLPKGDSQ